MKKKESIQSGQYEYTGMVMNGFVALVGFVVFFALLAYVIIIYGDADSAWVKWTSALGMLAFAFVSPGFFTQQPNQSRVMVFFGKYCGTFYKTGFYWANPLVLRCKMSLRLRNMDVAPIKVNDKVGNPVMIGLVLVWRVRETYRAVFDIDGPDQLVPQKGSPAKSVSRNDALENFVRIQSDAALREVTGHYAYDNDGNPDEVTLRSGSEEVNARIEEKLNERLRMAGIEVVEARLNYLAYAPEIAAVMLRRQQATAIISAREKIVEGAVSMVKMAVEELEKKEVVTLDMERKAAMVSNLMVVLCADESAQPVVNAGSLYN